MAPQHKTYCQVEHRLNQRITSFRPPLPELAISKVPVSPASKSLVKARLTASSRSARYRGAAPDPGRPSEISAKRVILSPGQARPYAGTSWARNGVAPLGALTLAGPAVPSAARRVPDRGDDLIAQSCWPSHYSR